VAAVQAAVSALLRLEPVQEPVPVRVQEPVSVLTLSVPMM
jgi:hypothetical protein